MFGAARPTWPGERNGNGGARVATASGGRQPYQPVAEEAVEEAVVVRHGCFAGEGRAEVAPRLPRERGPAPPSQRDRGTQYLSIRHTERLAQAGIEPSVGSRGDSYDNALAESVIGLFKTEVIRRRGPWRSHEDVEFATLEWVWWFNHRLLGTDRVRSASRVRGSVLPSRGRSDRSGGTQVNRSPEKSGRFQTQRCWLPW
jgi:transposase InsO family protein